MIIALSFPRRSAAGPLVLLACLGGGTATASAQLASSDALPVTGVVKHAGTYHVATGTWTRASGQTANLGPDVIYSNTAHTGYYFNSTTFGPDGEHIDEGGIPGSNNPHHPSANRDEYSVNSIRFGYCDYGAAGSGGWEFGFYNSYGLCRSASTPNVVPDQTVRSGGLPAGGCWTVQLDLTGAEFCLAADGGDGFDDDPDLDSFGWSFTYKGTDAVAGMSRGFMIAGDPQNTDPTWVAGALPGDGTNTYYGGSSLCTTGGVNGGAAATGYLTGDANWVNPDATSSSWPRCYFFGGYANFNGCGGAQAGSYASFYLELAADAGSCPTASGIGTTFCASLPNSSGANSTLEIRGSTRVSANDVQLEATVSPNSLGYFVTSLANAVPRPVDMGMLCLGGDIGRFNGPGQIGQAGANGQGIILDTTLGQWSLAGIPTSTGPYTAAAGTTTYFQCWHRDVVAGTLTSNFTDGSAVTWTP